MPNDEMRFSGGIKSPEEAYWFGFLVGDGCVYENRYRLKLSLQKKDLEHIDKFAKFLGYGKDRIHLYGSMAEFRVDNKRLLNSLYALGLCQNKVYKTHKGLIPNDFSRDFIRGLFDADGTVHLRSEGNHLTADFHIYGNYDLLGGVRDFLLRGIESTNSGYVSRGKPSTLGFRGRWLVEKIGRYLYDGTEVCLGRKRQIFQKLFEYNKNNIRKWSRFEGQDLTKIKNFYRKEGLSQKEIAKIFDVSQPLISRILNNKRYGKKSGGDI
jgi:intein/homing endonuclease